MRDFFSFAHPLGLKSANVSQDPFDVLHTRMLGRLLNALLILHPLTGIVFALTVNLPALYVNIVVLEVLVVEALALLAASYVRKGNLVLAYFLLSGIFNAHFVALGVVFGAGANVVPLIAMFAVGVMLIPQWSEKLLALHSVLSISALAISFSVSSFPPPIPLAPEQVLLINHITAAATCMGVVVVVFICRTCMALAKEENKQLNALRTDVERMMRHDLKSPLSAIVGVPDALLEDDNLNGQQRELLRMMHDSALRLEKMIELSMDIYKIEEGTYDHVPTPVDVRKTATAVCRDLHLTAQKQRVQLSLDFPETGADVEPMLISANDSLLCSLLGNLMKNAIEAAPEHGKVSVSITRNKETTTLAITNPGGVPQAIQRTFFDKYSTMGKKNGVGIGTYSARLFARAIQGDVVLDASMPGFTRVVVSLPSWRRDVSAVEAMAETKDGIQPLNPAYSAG